MIDAVTRLLPGAMGNDASAVTESFGERGLLEEPQYTRPADVPWLARCPRCCVSGDHGRIDRWRHAQALHRTLARRPDLGRAPAAGSPTPRRRLLEEFPAVPYP